jgi:hypothetical protein
MNAGFAVFSFLDAWTKGTLEKQAAYNECPSP